MSRPIFIPCGAACGMDGWSEDQERRTEAGVPEDVAFAKKAELGRQMLERAFAAEVPAAWVTADAHYGEDTDLRRWLEDQQRSYVVAVTSSHPIWQEGQQIRADEFAKTVPSAGWTLIRAGDGSEGNAAYEWGCLPVPSAHAAGMAYWLLIRRNPRAPTECGYFLVYGPEGTELAEMVRVAKLRWAIEESFLDAKSVVGLDQYEVRKWQAWYRHITLALLAHAYLEVISVHAAPDNRSGKRGMQLRTSSR